MLRGCLCHQHTNGTISPFLSSDNLKLPSLNHVVLHFTNVSIIILEIPFHWNSTSNPKISCASQPCIQIQAICPRLHVYSLQSQKYTYDVGPGRHTEIRRHAAIHLLKPREIFQKEKRIFLRLILKFPVYLSILVCATTAGFKLQKMEA